MRVVFINPIAALGGAELILLDLLAALGRSRPEVERHLITLDEGPLLDRAQALGIATHALPLPAPLGRIGDSGLRGRGRLGAALGLAWLGPAVLVATRRSARDLGRLIRDLEPTLVHSNGNKSHLLLALAAPRRVPVVWHVHDFLGSRPLMACALRRASRRATGVIAISEAVGRDARSVLGATPLRIVLNGIDLERFRPGPGDGRRLDALAGLDPAPTGTIRVGLVATYARWKGQDLFLNAVARLPIESLARFFVIGGPIYRTRGSQFTEAELRALASSLGVADRVGFVPFQEDPAEVFRALDVVVHASTLPEPFGRTIAEGMASGRAVVVSQAGGATELFADGRDAVGYRPGDAEALATALSTLISDSDRRDRLGRAARATAEARFDRDRLGREVFEAYESFHAGQRQATSH